MIAHVFRLIWNRKRSNALILTEIAVSFVVLCTVATTAAYFVGNWRRPLGFDYHDVWRVRFSFGNYQSYDDAGKRAVLETLARLENEVRGLDEVQAAALMENTPYSGSSSSWQMDARGRSLDILWGSTTPAGAAVLRFELVSGRWFEPGDEALAWRPIVVGAKLARDLFANESPLGQSLPRFDDAGRPRDRKEDETDYRVVGVLSDYRRDGEISASPYVAFDSVDFTRTEGFPPRRILVRVRPETPAAFEETLLRRLHAVAPDWSFDIATLAQRRHDMLRSKLLGLIVGGTVAGFLMIMVAMGLMGVLWQNVTRRTRELGIRRAVGATAAGVCLQILGELLALTTVAAATGSFLFLQAPVLGIASWVTWRIYLAGLAVSLAVLYTLVVLCGLYPSWLATRVHPAQALHYE
jgi:putative ABC transport system permease protein